MRQVVRSLPLCLQVETFFITDNIFLNKLLFDTVLRMQLFTLAQVRALIFHHYDPGLIHGPGVTCVLSLLLVLFLAPRVFLQVLKFSSLCKNQHSKFQFDLETVTRRATLWNVCCWILLHIPIPIWHFVTVATFNRKFVKGKL